MGTKEVHVITTLEQVKALADPLRVRILESLCEEERTTKQVAELLGERPTKLYHHVEALHKAGLIRATRTKQKRGTVEKYFRAVARRFTADSGLFSATPTAEESASLQEMIGSFFDNTVRELGAVIAGGDGEEALQRDGVLSFIEIEADAKTIARFRRRLSRLVEDVGALEEKKSKDGDGDRKRYRLSLAFFPLDS